VGGAERVTADVLRRLPRDRYTTRLYFLHEAGVVGRALIDEGFVAIERLLAGTSAPTALLQLARLFRQDRPDVVYCLDHHDAMTLGRLAGLVSGARGMIVASHATGLVGRRNVFGRLDRLLMDFTGRVVAVSRSHARYLHEHEGLPVSAVRVIENGIDLTAYPPVDAAARAEARRALDLAPDERVVVMVAAMRPEKAHEVLLDAVRALREEGVVVTVLLAGDGELRGALEDQAQFLAIQGQIRFLGVRHDVARLLHASDVAVLPSRDVVETLPLAMIEAMAVGIPVVASAVGSVPELVRHGETGCLIRPADGVALAAGIAHILAEPAAAAELARRGAETVRARFAIERTTRGYETLFDELMAV
jgi:glycosyltransferase involved in cell wall biosynthesis